MKVWATPIVGGTEWRIVETEPSECEKVKRLYGLCDYRTSTIFINRKRHASAPGNRESTRFHEEMHATGHVSGAIFTLQSILGLDDEKFTAVEEVIIRVWGQAMFDYLSRNGYLEYEQAPSVESDEKSADSSGLTPPVCGHESVGGDDESGEGI